MVNSGQYDNYIMKISVITVSFNASRTIAEALQSVAGQTHADIEHIVIDGASTDGTVGVIGCNSDRISKVLSEPDHGIYDAMNKGIALASGDVICFLNADDVYAEMSVISRVAKLMASEELDAVYGDAEFFSVNDDTKTVRRYSSRRFSPSRIAWGLMPAHPTLFLHRRVFERFGVFCPNYRIAGDFELVARIFHANTVKYRYIPEVLVRMRTGGVSTKGWRNTILLNLEVLRACRENGIPSNILMIIAKYPAKILEFVRK